MLKPVSVDAAVDRFFHSAEVHSSAFGSSMPANHVVSPRLNELDRLQTVLTDFFEGKQLAGRQAAIRRQMVQRVAQRLRAEMENVGRPTILWMLRHAIYWYCVVGGAFCRGVGLN